MVKRRAKICTLLVAMGAFLVGCNGGEGDIPEPEIPADCIVSYTAATAVSPTGSFGISIEKQTFTPEGEGGYGEYIFSVPIFMVGPSTFKNNTDLWTITLPSGVISLGDYAFRGCTALRSVELLGDGAEYLGKEIFYGCTSLEEFTVTDVVPAIQSKAFYGCSALKYVSIGDAVAELGESAFAGCVSIESIELPEATTWIGNHCFGDCTALKSIYICADEVASVGYRAFAGCASGLKIYVPAELVSAYKSDALWTAQGYTDLIYPFTSAAE